MQFFLIGIVLLLFVMLAVDKYKTANPENILYTMRWFFVAAILLFVLFLAATGKVQLVWLAFLSILPWVGRFRMLRGLYKRFQNKQSDHTNQKTDKQTPPPPSASDDMTRTQAYEILGLTAGASDADIRKAHRKLMKQNHPDTGGNPEKAALINRAKDTLLP